MQGYHAILLPVTVLLSSSSLLMLSMVWHLWGCRLEICYWHVNPAT